MNKEVRIEKHGPVDLMGVALIGNSQKDTFHSAWDHLKRLTDDLSISLDGKNLYGLQIYPPWFPSRSEITYMAAIEKNWDSEVPVEMLTKTIPRCNYVVHNVTDGVDGIEHALHYLYRDFIPKNKINIAMPLDFKKFHNIENKCEFYGCLEVWVPVIEQNLPFRV